MIARNNLISKIFIDLSYLREICIQSPIIIINTSCGIGKYTFNKIIYNSENDLIFEYKLVLDESFEDSMNISYNLGKYYGLSAEQLLYAFNNNNYS